MAAQVALLQAKEVSGAAGLFRSKGMPSQHSFKRVLAEVPSFVVVGVMQRSARVRETGQMKGDDQAPCRLADDRMWSMRTTRAGWRTEHSSR